jgi:hypothetical protein
MRWATFFCRNTGGPGLPSAAMGGKLPNEGFGGVDRDICFYDLCGAQHAPLDPRRGSQSGLVVSSPVCNFLFSLGVARMVLCALVVTDTQSVKDVAGPITAPAESLRSMPLGAPFRRWQILSGMPPLNGLLALFVLRTVGPV